MIDQMNYSCVIFGILNRRPIKKQLKANLKKERNLVLKITKSSLNFLAMCELNMEEITPLL